MLLNWVFYYVFKKTYWIIAKLSSGWITVLSWVNKSIWYFWSKDMSEENEFAPKWLAYLLIHSESTWRPLVILLPWQLRVSRNFLFYFFLWRHIAFFAFGRKECEVCGECNSKAHFPSVFWYFLILVKCLKNSH